MSVAIDRTAPLEVEVPSLRRKVAQGELGSLPVLVGLGAIWLAFALANGRFLSALNLTNLCLQIASMGTISLGIVLVLLLGEIDLSAGIVSGLAAAVTAVLSVKLGWSAAPALLGGVGAGAAIGLFHGIWITRLGVPSFVVTLAGLLGWQGALLFVLGETGTVNLHDEVILALTGTFFGPAVAWTLAALAIGGHATVMAVGRRRRANAGLAVAPWRSDLVRLAAPTLLVLGAVALFAQDRGLPLVVLVFLGLVLGLEAVLTRTRFGRHVLAVGGNAEAARRVGIRVRTVQVSVYAVGSALAALGGVLAASRLLAVNQSSGGGDVLLNSIAAAVIGGTSLFGGRGSAWSALLGALVIGSISNGMDLLAVSSSAKLMVTGGVLLVAASIDALSRNGKSPRK